jgi:hypothetical protein
MRKSDRQRVSSTASILVWSTTTSEAGLLSPVGGYVAKPSLVTVDDDGRAGLFQALHGVA